MKCLDSRGFTALELIVVTALLTGLLVFSLLTLRPKSYADVSADAERRQELAALAQGIQDYRRHIGGWPPALPDKQSPIANTEVGYDLCKYIVPDYVRDMAYDPQTGLAATGEADNLQPSLDICNAPGLEYVTGYSIQKNNKDNSISLSAPSAATGEIKVTIR